MKKLIYALAIAGIATTAVAQQNSITSYGEEVEVIVPVDKYRVETNRFWDNWFLTFGGGAQVLFGDYSSSGDFKDRIAPAAAIGVGKWFTPGIGLRLQLNGIQAKSFNLQKSPRVYGRTTDDMPYYKEEFKYINLHGDVLFNLTGMLAGYNENRVYDLIPYAGMGWNHTFSGPVSNTLAWNFGIINNFKLSKAWDLQVELLGMLTEDRFDGKVTGKKSDFVTGAMVGFTYKFPRRGFKHAGDDAAIVALSQAEKDAINAALAEKIAENKKLKADLAAKPREVIKEKIVVRDGTKVAAQSVFFPIGSSKLNKADEVNLQSIADVMKNNTDATLVLTGYADSKTGSEAVNKKLSDARANAVADALVRLGVGRDRIQTKAMGGVNDLTPPSNNRRVIIEMK